MAVVHERTMHIDPRNVHVSGPEGFDRDREEPGGDASERGRNR